MTYGGFYRRRRGILEHLEAGCISLFDAGVHDFLCLNAQSRVGTGSSIPPGVWIGSAKKVWLLTGRRESESKIKRSLAKLARIGWIKRFHVQGQRGDYPILISRFVVTDGDGNDFLINAEKTTNCRHPLLEPYPRHAPDLHLKRKRTPPEAPLFLQDIDTKIQRDEDTLGRSAPGVGVSPKTLFDIWNEEHGPLPAGHDFTSKRERKCRALLSRHKGQIDDFLNEFRDSIRKAAQTPFLRGEGDRGWKANFDWLVANDTNYLAVLEGKYDGRTGGIYGEGGASGQDRSGSAGRRTTMPGTLRESANYPFKPSEI